MNQAWKPTQKTELRQIQIEQYLPPVVRKVREYEGITSTENPELQLLLEAFQNALDDQFVYTATEKGIERWEKMLDIKPPPDSTLDQRRAAILAILLAKIPINLDIIQTIIETYLGVPVKLELWWNENNRTWGQIKNDFMNWGDVKRYKWGDFYQNREPYTITVHYQNTIEVTNLEPLLKMIYRLLPANLKVKFLFKYQTWGDIKRMYKNWGEVKQATWKRIKMGVK